MDEVDILIIGGGAAGLMAACSIVGSDKAVGLSVSLLERQEKAGRKILASGNGRCNLGNSGSLDGHYRGKDPDFVLPVFNAVDQTEYEEIFLNLGLPLFEDEAGRQYPRTLRSDTVHSALLNALTAGNVTVKYGLEVYDIEQSSGSSGDGFIVSFRSSESSHRSEARIEEGFVKAKAVIIATGGKSQAQLGGHDSGYGLAEALGHSRTELFPALVPIELADAGQWKRSSGQRIRASAYYESYAGKRTPVVNGEFLFTDYGVSGIAAMELAEAVERDQSQRKGGLIFDLVPEMSVEELSSFIMMQIHSYPEYDWAELLIGLLPLDILLILLRELKAGEIKKTVNGCNSLALAMKKFSRPVKATRGFNFAQLTAGGINTDEICPETLESKICPRLYLTGEMLDVNGDTGGYNLRWAFSSAYVAGESAVSNLK